MAGYHASDPLAGVPEGDVEHKAPDCNRHTMFGLMLGAMGVVFGDIGTSPLYALRATVLATEGALPNHVAVMGSLSMIFWALILVVTVKYVLIIMRADNNGEGGTLALAALAHRSPSMTRRVKATIGIGAIVGLALFFGDGILTPAVTVMAAVEGLKVENPHLASLVVPLSLVILTSLFLIQSRGTHKIGQLFGPVMVLWFVALGGFGLASLLRTPGILAAFNPWYGLLMFLHAPWVAFVSLGAVVLAVTGCEALYADMGHFGRKPIQYAWLFVALPALLLNYFGQGAALLRNPEQAEIAFFSVIPHWAHIPMVILATLAAIIASQAVITGVFSMTQQAVQLGQLPRMEIRHTSATDYGQIYVPRMNALLAVGVILIVLIFKSSDALTAAYGIAVSGVMVIDTFNAGIVAGKQWRWPFWFVIALFGAIGVSDLRIFTANTLKIHEGGWQPLFIAFCVFLGMDTWRRGRRVHLEKLRSESLPLSLFLERADKSTVRVAGLGVFLSSRTDIVPGALLHNLKHNKILHERVVIANVVVEDTPLVPPAQRLEVEKLGKGFYTVRIHHGFYEMPDVPQALQEARRFGLALDVDTATFFIGRETLVQAERSELGVLRNRLYRFLAGAALSPARFYHLPPNRVVELGTQVSI
ncbi:MAG: potassium transporter Kup [Alphaproteobacteria bacterium]|nr:potassium transporter Kup [Alphaproteobacteria bacterium]